MSYLYRAYGDDGRLLYVGITGNDVEQRFRQHDASGAEWVDQLAHVRWEWHDDRKAALAAESEAIKSEWPLYNIMGSIDGYRPGMRKAKRLGPGRRTERVRRAFYPDPIETLNAIAAQLVADEELCARVLADIKAWGGGSDVAA